jgi:predicted permease
MQAIASAILPVFFVAGSAYLLRRKIVMDARTLSNLNLYILIPALVYSSISRQSVEFAVFGRLAAGALLMLVIMTLVLTWVGRRRGLSGQDLSAFTMTVFMNLGNFGLPVAKFAFGDEGLTIAIFMMVWGSFLQNSVGIYFAQRSQYGMRKAALRVFRFPMVYAFALAICAREFNMNLPEAVTRAIDLSGEAAIPTQLLLLGIQLAETRLDTGKNVFLAAGLRLIAGPALAALIVIALGIQGMAAKVFILQMSGPVAVGMSSYGVQFDISPRFLSSVVAWTFLLSLLTVSAVLMLLGVNPAG